MRIIRVFPRRTKATPTDDMAFVGEPPLFVPECDEIHISVAFTWDIPEADRLSKRWARYGAVKIGGPAFGMPGGEFTPGLYVKKGYVITSRGCPNRCWFCSVWKREGGIRELPINDGTNVLDDNILACSDAHIASVFSMLGRQKAVDRIHFTGGLEAKILKPWHVDLLSELKPKQVFFAYDTPDDREPLLDAMSMFKARGWGTRNNLRCYCLIGHPKDTMKLAERRLREIVNIGMSPMAMLWRDDSGKTNAEWSDFQRKWARPAIIFSNMGETNGRSLLCSPVANGTARECGKGEG